MVVSRLTMATSARRSTLATGPRAVSGSWAKRAPGTFMKCTSPAKASVTGRRSGWPPTGVDPLLLVGLATVVMGAGGGTPRWQAANVSVATRSNAAERTVNGTGGAPMASLPPPALDNHGSVLRLMVQGPALARAA